MTPDVVVDVGNSRVKYAVMSHGRFGGIDGSTEEIAKDAVLFNSVYGKDRRVHWLVAGVNPKRQAETVAWALSRGDDVTEVTSHLQLPIKVDVEFPEKVGIDRLLGAVAANRLRTPGHAAITVDVGTAMTINLIDSAGVFRGGAILPGPRLMAQSLHDGTANLPRVETEFTESSFPGRSSEVAISVGIQFALSGAVRAAVQSITAGGDDPEVFLTGGDDGSVFWELTGFKPRSEPLHEFVFGTRSLRLPGSGVVLRSEPRLNLLGLLITAEALP